MENLKIPLHVGIILDGNGRWAQKKGFPRTYGHRYGAKTLEKVISAFQKFGVKTLTCYTFSTENWNRPKIEVDYLMKLFEDYLKSQKKKAIKNKIRVRVIGDKSRFSKSIQDGMTDIEEATNGFTDFNLNMAMNYSGRLEILNATRKVASLVRDGKLSLDDIDEAEFEKHLWTVSQNSPDLIIRTSGEQRLSGFLLWQCSYSEFYFPKVHFPDFDEEQVRLAIEEYTRRDRRYGKV